MSLSQALNQFAQNLGRYPPALFVLVLFGRHRSHPSYPSLPAVNRYSASHGRSVTSIASARWLTSSS